jgi:hypothetical protein
MFRSFSTTTTFAWVIAITGATFFGGLVVFLSSDAVKAELVTKAAIQQTNAKDAQQPALQKGVACSSRPWPNYEARCLFDKRRPLGELPTIRIIVLR